MFSDVPASAVISPNWYAVYIWARHEKRAADHLQRKGIEVFLPQYHAVHHWKNRVKAELELPLFPGYLFARIPLEEKLRVLEAPGAVFLVGTSKGPVPISTDEIEDLRRTVTLGKCEPHPYLGVGDRVRVIAGPMKGMEGMLVQFRQAYRIVISIDLIMRSMAVEVGQNDVERLSRTKCLRCKSGTRNGQCVLAEKDCCEYGGSHGSSCCLGVR